MKPLSYAAPSHTVTVAALLCLTVGGALAGPPAAAQPSTSPEPPGHLLRLVESRETGAAMVVDEVLVFRDGLTVVLRSGPGDRHEVMRARAGEAILAELGSALSGHRVGYQTSGCRVPALAPVIPGGVAGDRRHTLISWFGRGDGGRARHLEVSDEAEVFADECHPDMAALAQAAVAFSHRILSPGAGESVETGASLLLDLDNRMQAGFDCHDYGFAERVLIFRDGLVLRQVEDSEGGFVFTRGQASVLAMEELGGALRADRIGLQGGSCRLWFFLPFLVDEECADFDWWSSATWFGRRSRTSVLSGHHAEMQVCSPARSRLRRAILDTLLETLGSPATTTVSGELTTH